jgi:hypothetical protein
MEHFWFAAFPMPITLGQGIKTLFIIYLFKMKNSALVHSTNKN